MGLLFIFVFSQGAGGSLAYDYTKTYTKTFKGEWHHNYFQYTLPQDSFVSTSGIVTSSSNHNNRFKVNGGDCSSFWVDSYTTHSGGNRSDVERTRDTYIYFALCKKGDIISCDWSNSHTYGNITLTIVPAK